MGELIRREKAKAPQVFDGERYTAAAYGQVEVEHYHRYLLARHYCRGLDVLDIAAGEGYGSALLSQVARSVVGVEIDADVVKAAAAEYQRPNLRYACGDARKIPLEDASVDVAVSFETLEHIVEHDAFVAEIKRVLRPNGFMILSTPDSQVYSPMGSAPNPFHLLELSSEGFRTLLLQHFAHFEVLLQRAFMGSTILAESSKSGIISFENRGETIIEANNWMAHAPYMIAFASDTALPDISDSLFVHRNDLDTDFRVRVEAELARNEAQRARDVAEAARHEAEAARERDAVAAQARLDRVFALWKSRARTRIEMAERRMLKAEHEERAARHRAEAAEQVRAPLEAALEQARARQAVLQNAERERNDAQTQLNISSVALAETRHNYELEVARLVSEIRRLQAIEYSFSWRMTRPMRAIARRVPGLSLAIRRLTRLIWWTLTFQLGRRYKAWKARPAAGEPAPQNQLLEAPEKAVQTLPVAEGAADAPALESPSAVPALDDAHAKLTNIKFVQTPNPDVSIIIATYGHLQVTVDCLYSIFTNKPQASFEIILVDDAYYGSENMGLLGQIEGVRFLVNPENLGYLRTCNATAKHARGRYIYLLNNDTELAAGSIDALVAFLDSHADAGIVGSKLVYPDGRLQEAGGIVWKDASAWNYGHGQSPDRPEFNYVRQVDYCSGASLMMPHDLFLSLGGFDPVFAPAYYEDCDLCFRVRAQGLKVYFQPKSVVVHKEGVSHGVDVDTGIKRYQVVNQNVLRERWGQVLAAHYANGEHVLRARDRSWDRKVILIIEHYTLEPDRDAGSRSVMGIVSALLDAGWVVKFWPVNRLFSPVYTVQLEQIGVEVIDQRWPGDLRSWLFENGHELDHVLVSRPNFALDRLEDLLAHCTATLSFYGVDLHANRMRRQATLEHDLIMSSEADAMENLEVSSWPHFDVVLYPSEEEAELVREMSPDVLVRSILPFYADVYPARDVPPAGHDILFVAGFAHPPNVDAAVFLVNYVLPLLRSQIPDVTVTLAGSNPTDTVRELAGAGVTVTGYISNEALAALYRTHRVSVVPLRFGAGVKGKVVESLSHGLPIVTTSIGVEGIPGLREIVPVHDDEHGLAEALHTLIVDDGVWLEQSRREQAFVQRHYSFKAMQDSVLSALALGEAAWRKRQLQRQDGAELVWPAD